MVSISSLMHSVGWLKFRLVCKFCLLCITHRASYQASPKYLANVITIRTDYRPRRVGSTMILHQPITTTVYVESAFAVAAHKCWNALPADIRSTESEPLFKRIAKIFRRKDITLTRNRVIRFCIQNTMVPPIAGYF